jgi:rod shape-determining protein MreC
MKHKIKFSFASKTLLIIITILCLVSILFTFSVQSNGGPLQTVAGYILVPVQRGINFVGDWCSEKVSTLKSMKGLLEENEALQAKVDELTLENNELLQDRYEKQRLEELFEMKETYSDYDMVGARVIGKDPGSWFHVFMIDKGTNDGIAIDMNVIASGGLVGIVTEVGPNYATVRSIIDDSNNVSAMLMNTTDNFIVKGDLELMNDGVIRAEELKKDVEVNDGDKVVTSNISSKYLPGILIGVIKDLSIDSNNITKSGYITPVVDFEHLNEVLVIKQLKTDSIKDETFTEEGTAESSSDQTDTQQTDTQ